MLFAMTICHSRPHDVPAQQTQNGTPSTNTEDTTVRPLSGLHVLALARVRASPSPGRTGRQDGAIGQVEERRKRATVKRTIFTDNRPKLEQDHTRTACPLTAMQGLHSRQDANLQLARSVNIEFSPVADGYALSHKWHPSAKHMHRRVICTRCTKIRSNRSTVPKQKHSALWPTSPHSQ